jgi:hypothetical protein
MENPRFLDGYQSNSCLAAHVYSNVFDGRPGIIILVYVQPIQRYGPSSSASWSVLIFVLMTV